MIIYKTTNLINNKIYVGQDSKDNPKYLGSGLLLKKAINKYGKLNFVKETIEVCENKQILNEREIYWIEELNSINTKIGYNVADGGFGGNTYTEETKKRVSDMLKGRHVSDETKKKMSDLKRNKTPEQKLETYRKFYLSRTGNELNEEQLRLKLQEIKKNEF
jgi:group I intron endonuclease